MNQVIFDFLCNYLKNLNIPYFLSNDKNFTLADLDLGLRKSILKDNLIKTVFSMPEYNKEALYHFSDYYNCHYSFFHLAEEHFFFIGPYLQKDMLEADIKELITISDIPESLLPQLQDYYFCLPLIRDKISFFELIRQSHHNICGLSGTPEYIFDLRTLESREEYLKKHTFIVHDDPLLSMSMLEKRYYMEDEFLDAISHGNTDKALSILHRMSNIRIAARSDDELRDIKNMILSLNTLLRRTAYTTGVHPFYIDAISANYAKFIENAATIQHLDDVLPYLVRSYCELVKKRSTSNYSEPIRQILVTIDASIDSDLSLKRFSNELFLNTSYLSSLFKKETGVTLTDYVNQHRIDYAKRLLKSTTLSIQTVAATVGISDIHYFTRLFRRITGCSPREFRKS